MKAHEKYISNSAPLIAASASYAQARYQQSRRSRHTKKSATQHYYAHKDDLLQ